MFSDKNILLRQLTGGNNKSSYFHKKGFDKVIKCGLGKTRISLVCHTIEKVGLAFLRPTKVYCSLLWPILSQFLPFGTILQTSFFFFSRNFRKYIGPMLLKQARTLSLPNLPEIKHFKGFTSFRSSNHL